MTDTKPRDLTMEEMAQLDAKVVIEAGTVPLRIPPGTGLPVELLNPLAAEVASLAAPSVDPAKALNQVMPILLPSPS